MSSAIEDGSSSADNQDPALAAIAAYGKGQAIAPAALAALPAEAARTAWKALKAAAKEREKPLTCKYIIPFVKGCWAVESLDLSDCGRWVTDDSLQALACVDSVASLRLTTCKFLSDAGPAAFAAPRLPRLQTLDVSWTELGDAALANGIGRCSPSLTSLNLTGLARVTDHGISSLLALTRLERLSLASTGITDAGLDYLTYYTRYPDAGPAHVGVHNLKRLELSNCQALTDVGVGKLVAVYEDGKPYGKVFKDLEYLALSSTPNVPTAAVTQVKVKYGFDAPLPNAQRTLAKSNSVALDAQQWVLRLPPAADRPLPTPSRTWEQDRVLGYVAQYTKEMAASVDVIRRLTAADNGGPPMNPVANGGGRDGGGEGAPGSGSATLPPGGPDAKRPRTSA